MVAMPSWILCSRGNILEADPKTGFSAGTKEKQLDARARSRRHPVSFHSMQRAWGLARSSLDHPRGTPWHKPTFLQDRELWEASGPRAPWAGRIQVPELQALSPDCAVDNRPSLLKNSQSPSLSLKHKM